MDIQQVILDELRSFRTETNNRLRELERVKNETDGAKGVVKILLSTSIVSALVSWVSSTFHH